MKKWLIGILALLLLCGVACAEEYALSHGYRLFEAFGKFGLKNETGATVLPAEYDEIGGFALWPDGVYRAAIMKNGLAGWYPAKTDAPVECRFDPSSLKNPQLFGNCILIGEYLYDFDGNRISDQRYYRMWPVNDEIAALKAFKNADDTEEDVWSQDYHTDTIFVDRDLNERFRLPYDYCNGEANGVLLLSDYRNRVWTNAFADLDGNILYEDHESWTYSYAGSGYYRAFMNGDGYCGLMDPDFNFAIDMELRWITDFINGYAVICDADDRSDPNTRYLCALINDKLEEVMSFRIGTDLNSVWCNGKIIVNDGDHGLYYVHDMDKKLLLKAKFVDKPWDGRIRFQSEEGLWGYMDEAGAIYSLPTLLDAENYSEGFAKVRDQENRCFFLREDGSRAFSEKWDYAESFRDGYAYVRDKNGGRFIDTEGKIVRPAMASLDTFYDSYTPYASAENSDGSINRIYAEARGYKIFTANDGRMGLMDADENILLEAVYDEIQPPVDWNGSVYVILRRGDRYGWYAADGSCDCLWREVKGCFRGRFFAEDYDTAEYAMCLSDGSVIERLESYTVLREDRIALYRANQPASVCDGDFNELFTLDGSLFPEKNGMMRFWRSNGKYGFCDTQGKVVIEPVYVYADDFDENGYAKVQDYGENAALIDRNENMAVDFGRYEMILPFEHACYICRGEDAGIGPSGESGMIIPRAYYDVLDKDLNVTASFFGNYLGVSANGVISYVEWDESVKYSDDYDFDNPPPSVTHYIYADGSSAPQEEPYGNYPEDYMHYDENGYAEKTGSWIDRNGNAVAPYNVQEQDGWW